MKNIDYLELINGYKRSLTRKEAVLQVNFLIKKEHFESAKIIIDIYELNLGELTFQGLSQEDFEKYLKYEKNK